MYWVRSICALRVDHSTLIGQGAGAQGLIGIVSLVGAVEV